MSDFASILYNFVLSPIYETLGIDTIAYCIEHSNYSTLIVSGDSLKTLVKVACPQNLKNLIVLDRVDKELVAQIEAKNLKIYYYEELINGVTVKRHPYRKLHEQDVFTFSYTSGTTGKSIGEV